MNHLIVKLAVYFNDMYPLQFGTAVNIIYSIIHLILQCNKSIFFCKIVITFDFLVFTKNMHILFFVESKTLAGRLFLKTNHFNVFFDSMLIKSLIYQKCIYLDAQSQLLYKLN